MKSTTKITTALAAAALWAMPAVAGEEHDVNIVTRGAFVSGDSMLMTLDDKDGVIALTIDGGKIMVKVNGREVSKDRIQMKDGRIIILGEDGKEMRSFFMVSPGDDKLARFAWQLPGQNGAFTELWQVEPPNVMIGIHMAEPGEALRKHLRLEPGETTMISRIYEGLAADEAGLEQYDVIIEVNGRRPADQKRIREILGDKEAGDEIVFTVIHEGRTRKYEVVLEAFDATRMNQPGVLGGDFDVFVPDVKFEFEGDRFNHWREYLFDPNTQMRFRQYFGDKFPVQMQEQLRDVLKESGVSHDLEEHLQKLNERLDELQEMIEQLTEQAREFGRERRR